MRPHYGIDAPGLVRAFFLAGGALALTALGLGVWAASGAGWAVVGAVVLVLVALYPLGMGCLMLYDSLRTKVRGREAILDLVVWRGDERVLDVGCGRGLLLVGAARRLASGRAVGIDLWRGEDQSANTPEAALANARHEGVAARVEVVTGDMRALPFPDSSFDVIVSGWAVHNLDAIEDRRTALAEMVRVVKPGGAILLNDIVNRDEYCRVFTELGLKDVRIVLPSVLRDRVLRAVSFGSYGPATVVARSARTP